MCPGVCPLVSSATIPGAISAPGLTRVSLGSMALSTRLAPAAMPSMGPVSLAASADVQNVNSRSDMT